MVAASNLIAEMMEKIRYDPPDELNSATEGEWIARFLLFFMTLPMTNKDSLKDAWEVWESYVVDEEYPTTITTIYRLLAQEGWHPSLQKAFVEDLCPLLL